jgi:hypothetical protein
MLRSVVNEMPRDLSWQSEDGCEYLKRLHFRC